ncbi:MAG: aldehyde:ferredoxin oxidoreductase, partial [Azoarcus sp.]|nr:aldehyde:ferredoxin oxidoreductase [Azoarcus sp.]
REGFGDTIADPARAVERGKYPAEALEYRMAVKGLFQSDPHDARILKAFALGLSVATRGMDHLRNRVTLEINARVNDDAPFKTQLYGGTVAPQPNSYEGKEIAVRRCENTFAVGDSVGMCRFNTKLFNSPTLPDCGDFAAQLSTMTGQPVTAEELDEVGRNITGLEHLLNFRLGLRARDDTLPKRWFEESIDTGPFKGEKIERKEFDAMKARFYELTGLNAEGVPRADWHQQLALAATGFALRVELPRPLPGAPEKSIVIDRPVANVAELRDASGLWGKTVWQTEELLKKTLQDPLLRVSSIGRAGENQVLYASIVNDLHRAAGRSGVGAVAGSKGLKAIAVRGTKGVGNIKDPKAFMIAVKQAKKVLADNAVTGQGLPTYGTQVLMNVINEVGALPTRNHRDVQFEGAKDISAEAMATPRKTDGKKHLVTNQACFGCTIACGRISKMDESHFTVQNKPQYWGASGGLEYEAAWALGAANGVNDLEALQYANQLCNEDGIDPISFGATVGAVMELYEMGVLTKEQVGIEAKFGSAQALAFLAEQTVTGQGFGKEVGQGSKRLTAKYGHPDLSMSVKGQEFPAYDGRGIQGMGLAYAISNRGACHLRGYTVASEVMGIPVKTDPLATEGKPELVKAFQDATAAFDSSG